MQSRIVVLALLATLFLASPARADGLTAAEFLLMQEKDESARAALIKWLASNGPASDGLLRAAQIGRYLQDIDLLRQVRAVGETLEERRKNDSVSLALGYAYLGLAEENLRLQTGSRSISLYFADAEARDTDGLLLAETRYAQGDLAGALAEMRRRRTGWEEQGASVLTEHDYIQGRYEYETAAAAPVDAQGRPNASAASGFAAAVKFLTAALNSDGDPIYPRKRRQALLWRAYSRHRTGHVDLAEADYMAAYKEGTRAGTLVLRGISSLYARRTKEFPGALDRLAALGNDGPRLTDMRVGAHLSVGNNDKALEIAQAWRDRDSFNPAARLAVARALWAMKRLDEAHAIHMRILAFDPGHQLASRAVEVMARQVASEDFDRCVALYEDLLHARPKDPYVRNNYGFLLREWVSPHTDMLEGGIQKLKTDAPPVARERLRRCAAVYGEAAALIDPAEDGSREELVAWNLAGIVNDYGLIIHYFADVQNAELAEAQYLRVMKMTDWTFKDTYSPNMHRLYRYVLKDRLLSWYRAAREARTAILKEAAGPDGLTLVPDARKRAAAQRDLEGLRARILRELKKDADEDGIGWPPGENPAPPGKEK